MRALLIGTAGLLASAGAAVAADTEIEIRDAVARVTVVTEDRSDVDVQITQGSAPLPQITVRREGGKTIIDGDLGRRDIRECQARDGGAPIVRVRGERIALNDAPRIVVRAPRRDLEVGAEGAVWGSIGRTERLELSNAGCGDWTVANVSGPLEIAVAGSGDVQAGSAGSAEIAIAGSGDVSLTRVGALEVAIAGSGDVRVGRMDGALEASIAGSGDVIIDSGQATRAEANIAGSGDIRLAGSVQDLSANLIGSGDIRVARVTGNVRRSKLGSGDVIVGTR